MCTWIISSDRLKLFVASKLCVMLCDVDLYYEWFFYLRQHFLLIFFIFLKPQLFQTLLYQEFCYSIFFQTCIPFQIHIQ